MPDEKKDGEHRDHAHGAFGTPEDKREPQVEDKAVRGPKDEPKPEAK